MPPTAVRVAIIEPVPMSEPLEFPDSPGATVVLRAAWNGATIDQLERLEVRVAVLDLRGIPTPDIGGLMREVRESPLRPAIVAVTDPGDDASAQFALACGAVAHLGRDYSPLALLRASHAASRNSLHLGRTGQRAMRRLTPDRED